MKEKIKRVVSRNKGKFLTAIIAVIGFGIYKGIQELKKSFKYEYETVLSYAPGIYTFSVWIVDGDAQYFAGSVEFTGYKSEKELLKVLSQTIDSLYKFDKWVLNGGTIEVSIKDTGAKFRLLVDLVYTKIQLERGSSMKEIAAEINRGV